MNLFEFSFGFSDGTILFFFLLRVKSKRRSKPNSKKKSATRKKILSCFFMKIDFDCGALTDNARNVFEYMYRKYVP